VTVPGHAVATIVTAIWEKSCDLELKNPTYGALGATEPEADPAPAEANAATIA
jgi:hypothetical protein